MISTQNELVILKNWLKTACALAHVELHALADNASFRRYFRVHVANQSYVVMLAPPDKENISAFIAIARNFSSQGIHVPQILAYNMEHGFILLSDLGDELYFNLLSSETADDLYTRALAVLLKIQVCKPTLQDKQPLGFFDEQFIRLELNLFVDWFLIRHLQFDLTPQRHALLENVFKLLITSALEQPRVCVHRDYHARNLLLIHKQTVGVLDFQDALYGPITYDAVSLLRDAYLDWPERAVNQWVSTFHHMLRPQYRFSHEEFLRWFDLLGVQRHLKILGIFARLCYRDHKPYYLENTGRLVGYLQQICEKYAELHALKELLLTIQNILNAMEKK